MDPGLDRVAEYHRADIAASEASDSSMAFVDWAMARVNETPAQKLARLCDMVEERG